MRASACAGILVIAALGPGVSFGTATAAITSIAHTPCGSRVPASALALPIVAGETAPELVLLQRSIEREWGLSEDSVWVEHEVPEWRSEAIAAMMSAVLPGSGQVWVDGPGRGFWFALAEAAAWTARTLLQRSGNEVREDAATFAGVPGDSTSNWSYARWEAVTAGDSELLELYAADPEAFYDAIATDPRYLPGWAGDPVASQHDFIVLRETSERRLRGARFSEQLLWVNHVVAAVDALRAARLHNRTLLPGGIGISIRGGWHRGPDVTAVLERRF